MSEDLENVDNDNTESTGLVKMINSLHEIQLPSIVKKNLFTAVGKLITGIADAGVAHIEAHIDTVRARGKANALIIEENAKAVAARFNDDPNLVTRGIHFYENRLFRSQKTREKITSWAIEDLQNSPPSTDPDKEIDPDWLEQFIRHSEHVTSDELQRVYAKILAGEVSKPGQFYPQTLQTLSIINQNIALAFIQFCSHCFTGYPSTFLITDFIQLTNDYSDFAKYSYNPSLFVALQEYFLVRPNLKEQLELTQQGFIQDHVVGSYKLRFKPKQVTNLRKIGINCINLTLAGYQLSKIIGRVPVKEQFVDDYIKWAEQKYGLILAHKEKLDV